MLYRTYRLNVEPQRNTQLNSKSVVSSAQHNIETVSHTSGCVIEEPALGFFPAKSCIGCCGYTHRLLQIRELATRLTN